ncbi:MAG: minor capsid protein [Haemophilus influenzae]|nr:minor capsid protein [Haemophilus influenzae]
MAIKRKVKKPSVWLYPTAIERDYVYALDSLTDDLLTEVSQFCNQQEKFYRLHQDGIFDWLERVFNELLTSMMFHVSPHKVQKMVRKSLDETNQFNKKQFHKMLKKAYGVDIFTAENGLSDKLKLFELQNINLIKSIPTQLHEKLRYKFVEAVQKGKRWETLIDEVQELGQVTRNRARLIARDQIGKLNGQLTQIRQEEIGVKQYIWRTSLDERVRKQHLHREGETFDWANPPDDGHPGEPIRCRCYAEAVLPDLGNLTQSTFVPSVQSVPVFETDRVLPVVQTKFGEMAFSEKQLDRKFKHYKEYFDGNANSNRVTRALYQKALVDHLNNPSTFEFGHYRDDKESKVYYNRDNGYVAAFNASGLITFMKMNRDSQQWKNYLKNGMLR